MSLLNPDHVRAVLKAINQGPYLKHLSMPVKEMGTGYSVVELTVGNEHFHPFGRIHGGAYASVIDTAAYWAVYCELDEKVGFTSIDFGYEPKAVSRIKDYLNAHFKKNVSIDELARITQLSRAYLIRSFQCCVGIPPYAYLIQTRIRHAKKLLAKKMPVVQVAYEMGFSDQSHLTRHFKSITGITPKQYAIGHYS